MTNRAKLLILLLVLAIGSTFLAYRLTDDKPESPTSRKQHKPDYFLKHFSTLTMHEDGSPRHRLSAEYMAHFPGDETTELILPKLELFHDDTPPTLVTSEKGWITSNNEVILLSGNVHLLAKDENKQLKLQVDTQDVKILLDTNYAETEALATIRTKTATINTVGIRAYLDQKRVELMNNVKATLSNKP